VDGDPREGARRGVRRAEPVRLDLVKLMTISARQGRGNFLWADWNAGLAGEKPRRADRIAFGSQLLLVTPASALGLVARMGQVDLREAASGATGLSPPPPGAPALNETHWGLALEDILEFDGGLGLRAAYLAPPLGSFAAHPSGIDKKLLGSNARQSCWAEAWCM
jgi:hypothetical protein